MSLYLSVADIQDVQVALRTLLSPLAFDSLLAWRLQVHRQLGALLHPDTAISFLPAKGELPLLANRPVSLADYATHYGRLFLSHTFPATEAFVWPTGSARLSIPSERDWFRGESCDEWVRRERLCHPRGMMVARSPRDLPCETFPRWSGVAAFFFHDHTERSGRNPERELSILKLLLPAFEGAVDLIIRLPENQRRLESVVDMLSDGLALIDDSGRTVHENVALRRFMANEHDTGPLRKACAHTAAALAALVSHADSKSRPRALECPAALRVSTPTGHYRIEGGVLGDGGETALLLCVLVSRMSRPPLSSRELRGHYGLTAREISVATLLAQGRSNREIARILGLSIHTARRHTEHVLMKLDVHTRAAVAAKMQDAEGGTPAVLR